MNKKLIIILSLVVLVLVIGICWLLLKRSKPSTTTTVRTTVTPSAESSQVEASPVAQKTDTSGLPFERENNTVFSDTGANNLEVIQLADGRYRLFYHQVNQILSAISTDGKTFTKESGTRLSGSMPATIKLSDGRYRMYFSSSNALKSATSSDGLTFKVEDGIRLSPGAKGSLDAQGIIHPSIIQLPDGSYRLYYDGVSSHPQGGDLPNWRIMSARSTDGLIWTKDEGVRIPVDGGEVDTEERYKFEMSFSAHAEYKDGTFILYFTSQGEPMSKSGIWRAVSSDGLTFTVDTAPLLARDPKYGDKEDMSKGGPKGMPQDPFILKVSGGERLFYWTSDGGYATAFRSTK